MKKVLVDPVNEKEIKHWDAYRGKCGEAVKENTNVVEHMKKWYGDQGYCEFGELEDKQADDDHRKAA